MMTIRSTIDTKSKAGCHAGFLRKIGSAKTHGAPVLYYEGGLRIGIDMYYTEEQAASQLGVNKKTVRALIVAGRLRAIDVGSRRHCYRVHPDDLKNISPAGPAVTTPPPARRRFRRQGATEGVQSFLPSA